jgi:hypothetical protein
MNKKIEDNENNISAYKVYLNEDLMNYIESFIRCPECKQEFEPSYVIDGCKNCVIKAWEYFGYC